MLVPDRLEWNAAVLALAVAIDLVLGDPPNRWHPVAWLGASLGWGRARLATGSPPALLAKGALLVVAVAGLAGVVGWAASRSLPAWGWAGLIAEAIALEMAISLRSLVRACRQVARALERGDLDEAQHLVGYHLVSRPTEDLDARLVASAAVESAAENFTDAFVAPLVWYLALGLGGVWIYRTVNTADAMIGYRAGALEHFGKVAARLDDVLNLIPARLGAIVLVATAWLSGDDAKGAWRAMWRDHGRTSSPNAGWTMSAAAGALGVTLEKPGAYRLGSGPYPGPAHVDRSARLVLLAAFVTLAALIGGLLGTAALARGG